VGYNGDVSYVLVHCAQGAGNLKKSAILSPGPGERKGYRAGRAGRARMPCEIRKKIRPRNLSVPGPNLGVGARHALFPITYVGRTRFRGPYAPRRHSSRHAKISISWRDRSYRCRLESIE
jgi:hypothetical protein